MKKRQSPELKRARSAWKALRQRCLNPRESSYYRYGGAGIRVCPQWESFEQFLADMGLPPTPKHWLGRMDVRGHYVKDNCSWILQQPQQRRRRNCVIVRVAGEAMTATDATRLPGKPMSHTTIVRRWKRGYSMDAPALAKIYKKSRWLTYQGESLPVPEWARRAGLTYEALRQRLKAGWTVERALTTPLRIHHQPQRKKPNVQSK